MWERWAAWVFWLPARGSCTRARRKPHHRIGWGTPRPMSLSFRSQAVIGCSGHCHRLINPSSRFRSYRRPPDPFLRLLRPRCPPAFTRLSRIAASWWCRGPNRMTGVSSGQEAEIPRCRSSSRSYGSSLGARLSRVRRSVLPSPTDSALKPRRQLREFLMRLFLVPVADGSDVVLQGQVASAVLPAQGLDGDL